MLRIPKSKMSELIEIYQVTEDDKSYFLPSTIGRFYKFSQNEQLVREYTTTHRVLWLHTTFEINGFVVAMCWSAPTPVHPGGWMCSHQLTTWTYPNCE
mgnify:CR=1